MSDHFKAVIETLQGEVVEKEKEIVDLKKTINSLCPKANIPPIYPDIELKSTGSSSGQFRNDHFYGQPLASAIREILSARKAGGHGAASVGDIYTTLINGGFKFDVSNEDNAKRGLRISLSKNNVTFHKLPNGNWGLRDWYPNIKDTKEKPDDEEESPETAASSPLGKDGEDGVMLGNKKATS
jgi:hypothetical protein